MLLVNLWVDTSTLNPYISNTLLTQIEEVISKWEKAILYLNKRGQFSSIVCNDCQHLFKCKNCDISMSVHKYPSQFTCHLCSYSENIPLECKKCHWVNLSHIWVWTQQIEDSLKQHFTSAKVFRFDTDTMKTKKSKTEALELLNNADIIIGTKMITTGFNFKKVGLIWVMLVEQELQIPKYNTEESVYTNIRQLLGRWGRIDQKTEFVIQSFIPDNEIVQSIVSHNYREFLVKTLEERKLFSYPPFWEIATLEFRHKSEQKALDFMIQLHNKLELELHSPSLEGRGLGTGIEVIFNKSPMKKFNQFYYKIIIKWENIREVLQMIKPEIIRNSGLSVSFD